MFSYLRPRSRHGATNHSELSDASRTSQSTPDYLSSFPPPRHPPPLPPSPPSSQITREQETYRSPISVRAPILPPIPRVASIYGSPPQSLAIEDQQKGVPAGNYHSRVHSIEEDKILQNVDASPKSTAPVTGTRPRNNFSRPFHGRDGSFTPSEERNHLQEIWRSAAQTAHFNETQQSRGKSFQPFVNTTLAQQDMKTEGSNSGIVHTPRMPFQYELSDELKLSSPQKLSPSSPHLRQSSESGIAQAHSEAVPHSRIGFGRPSDSQIGSPISSARDATSPRLKQPIIMAQPAQSKPNRFTRLNPMSLLSRRRSSQPSTQPENDMYRRNIVMGSPLLQDYVGIRGNRIHDFSEPRPKKVVSHQTTASGSSDKSPDNRNGLLHVRAISRDGSSSLSVPSPSPERISQSPNIHTPVFNESPENGGKETGHHNLDDVQNKTSFPSAQESSSEYSDSDSEYDSEIDDSPRDPLLLGDPTFGLFSAPDNVSEPQEFSFVVPKHLAGPPPPPRTPRSRSQTPNHDRAGKGKSHNPPSAPRTPRSRSQTPSDQENSRKNSRAPRSASTPPLRESRTPSPQLAHLPRHSKSNASRFSFDLAGFGSSVQEKMLEDRHRQKISKDLRVDKMSGMFVPETDMGFDSDDPGFDDDDLEEEVPGMNVDEDDFPMASSIANSTLNSIAVQSSSLMTGNQRSLYTQPNIAMELEPNKAEAEITPKPSKSYILRSGMFQTNQAQFDSSDDFYFDDGAITAEDFQTTGEFDESVFDDPSHVIGQHIQTSLAIVPEQQSQESSQPSTRPMSLESTHAIGHGFQASNDTSRTSIPPVQAWDKTTGVKRSSMLKNDAITSREIQTNLTRGNLAAYHDALALATQQAATEGRFDRNASIEERSMTNDMLHQQSGIHVNNSFGLQVDSLTPYDDLQDRVTFDDYEQEDDDVIAAANADALDYDEEFYGEEFHFYSKGDGDVGGESQYGGVFVNDIKRSHSGRVNGQEPSLTPITEISEWSTRNSMVSLTMDRNHANIMQQQQQPGLAQIADSLRDEDESDEISISALKRLRQTTFASASTNPISNNKTNNNNNNKSHQPRVQPSESTTDPHLLPDLSSEFKKPFVKSHSRNSSGAESVAYIHENDAEGSRWVLERRRTTEHGHVEVLGREIIEGGRI